MGRGKGIVKAFYRECFDCGTTWGASISKNKNRPTWGDCPMCGQSIGWLTSTHLDYINAEMWRSSEYQERKQIEYGIAWAND